MRTELSRLSLEEGARTLALAYLDQAREGAAALQRGEDPEALHDFRVALRRLRSVFRAYRATLEPSVGRKARRRLRAVAALTGPGRDAEVQLAWVEAQLPTLDPQQRAGGQFLARALVAQKRDAYAKVRGRVLRDFARLEKRLRPRLFSYTLTLRVGEPARLASMAAHTAVVIRTYCDALSGRLRRFEADGDEAQAHRARIDAKRLRYLLDPLRDEHEWVREAVKALKALQDLLGELNDLHNLRRTVGWALEHAAVERATRLRKAAEGGGLEAALHDDERAGLVELMRRLEGRRAALKERLLRVWLAEEARLPSLVERLQATAERLFSTDSPESPFEIERKFLLTALPPNCREYPFVELDQGWLPGSAIVERIRRTRGKGRERYTRTVKFGAGVRRWEFEEDCDQTMFDQLWPLTRGRRVRKQRYMVAHGELTWEVDVFEDTTLVLAEVELPNERTEVTPPDWMKPFVVREVTGEADFVNVNLAR